MTPILILADQDILENLKAQLVENFDDSVHLPVVTPATIKNHSYLLLNREPFVFLAGYRDLFTMKQLQHKVGHLYNAHYFVKCPLKLYCKNKIKSVAKRIYEAV